jgi:transposase
MTKTQQEQIRGTKNLSDQDKTAFICQQQYRINELEKRIEQLTCTHEKGECVNCKNKDLTIAELKEIINHLHTQKYKRSSERRIKQPKQKTPSDKPKSEKRVRLPSEQYPNAKITEETIAQAVPPQCDDCHEDMTDSGLRETSERLEMIPMQIFILRIHRVRYHCKNCQCAPVTTPLPPRIAPNSSLQDSVLIEASLTKFYDLIPTERIAKILDRSSHIDISDKLLLSAQQTLAKALYPVYMMLKQEIQLAKVVHADETTHRMLEENKGKYHWYLWSFSCKNAVYFEIHDTRAGDVSIEFIQEAQCTILVSDVYSGYIRTVREVNAYRATKNLPLLVPAYCNDHSRRYFIKAEKHETAVKVIKIYSKIYDIESKIQNLIKKPIFLPPETVENALQLRNSMDPYYNEIYDIACNILLNNPDTSDIGRAASYFIKNIKGLTMFLKDLDIPISNAVAERSIRNPVIGRKTWYGTHSEDGAKTNAIHFSLCESCRLNEVEPRAYYYFLRQLLLEGKELITPFQYKQLLQTKPPPEAILNS